VTVERTVDVSAHPFVRRLLSDHARGLAVDCTIHRDDEMLIEALREHDWDSAVSSYVQVGLQAFHSHRQIIDLFFEGGFHGQVLEFASGFGRVTRFLSAFHGPGKVTAAEIQEPALRFVAKQFGVRTIRSTHTSLDIEPDQRFGAVIAHSFFSHMHDRRFRQWLARLYRMTERGGIFVFSVHDESLIPESERDPSGMAFRTGSESDRLDRQEYGSSWVSEDFVRRAVAESCPGALLYRWPRGLANYQDLYIATATEVDREAVDLLDQGPFGFLGITPRRGNRIEVVGWASHWNPRHSVAAIVVAINGNALQVTTTFVARPDAVGLTGDRRHLNSGWRCRFRVPLDCSLATDVLTVTAQSDSGAETVLYVGTIAQALAAFYRTENSEKMDEADEADERIFGWWNVVQADEATRKQAESIVERLLAVDPESAYGHRLRALIAFSRGELPEGIAALRQSLAKREDAENLTWLCVAYSLAGCTDLARPSAERLSTLRPQSLTSIAGRIIVTWLSGDFRETLRLSSEAQQLGDTASASYVVTLMGHYLGESLEPENVDPESFFKLLHECVRHAVRGETVAIPLELAKLARRDPQYAVEVAGALALAGHSDAALEWLVIAMDAGFLHHVYLAQHNPFLRSLRHDERFESLLAEMRRRGAEVRAKLE
jgi:SAM-dependent methyltransferase